ncbi:MULTISPECIES: DNA polymerase III subunit gamma/tau [Acinetobacter]|jgi:DNA polymerase-3 subunit gamma/tau|uniref:DNA polymerase III subunit gamma/tau n=1 Tax=Acinetobacter TaxID=469 RepID=UPI000B3C0DCD|nr:MULTISPECIES: DNA polymerase III subunit gamma/tau [Acinetobacter]AXY60406.1 DNA polymerase III subunit gamma/tau [Acinetobacter sp. WCHAc010052]WOE40316.1 DNA polymerase III subunit gamma/tau [Acinetobacter chinensis]
MYQVLARKYRPRNFNELVGQNHVSRALTSALDRGRLHHAYLFTGTRGVGKTTIARILAKCLNCETGITSTPCEVCATCKSVNEGRFIDLIEIDAASRTKVEDTRELLDNVPYAPTQGRFKVYLIDEVHMLSTHSFNALLKTLEEPPEHVKFLFATTDPQKLPITVISRCLQFTLRPLAVDEITEHLSSILSKEEIGVDQDAVWQIAESAQGSLRDALSLTDQAIAYGQGEIRHQDVKDMLGLIDRTIIYDLILSIHQNQRQRVSELLMQFRQQALDVSMVLDQLISTLHELALLQYLPELSLKYSAEINRKITHLSQVISAQDLQLYYQVACKGRADLQLAVTQEQGFEMCVLRLLAFRPLSVNELPVSRTVSAVSDNVPVQSDSAPQSALSQTVETPPAELSVQIQVAPDEPVHEASSENEHNDVQPEQKQVEDQSQQSSADQENDQIVFDPNHGEVLFGDDLIAESVETATVAAADISDTDALNLFDPVESSTESVMPQDMPEPAPQQAVQQQEHPSVTDESAEPATQTTEVPVAVQEAVIPETADKLMPQQILEIPPQDMSGEWDAKKWEYWFRNSSLSPAVQELAQHGVMTGQIDGSCVFHIPQQYEKLLHQLQYALEEALKQQWSATVFSVQYGEVNEITPFTMQNERKQKAFNRAEEMLHQEPVIKELIQAFDARLENIELK